MLFQKYTTSAVDNIDHPYTVIGWKSNMDKADYEDKQYWGVYIHYEKR